MPSRDLINIKFINYCWDNSFLDILDLQMDLHLSMQDSNIKYSKWANANV